jgi:hypothetical protein
MVPVPLVSLLLLLLLLQLRATSPSSHLEHYTFYDYDAPAQHGFCSFGWAGGLSPSGEPPWATFDDAYRTLGFKAMIDLSDRCTPGWKVYDGPYCPPAGWHHGGPAGLAQNWTEAVDRYVAEVAKRKHVVGVFFGDEPVISGVPQSEVCALVNYTKHALGAAGRPDVFTYYNDAPAPLLEMQHGLCEGLDYISADIYLPATQQQAGVGKGALIAAEASAVKKIYDVVKQKLGPTQKLWVVPGLYWDGGANETVWKAQPEPPVEVQHQMVALLDGFWDYASADASIIGFNSWHFLARGWAAGGTGVSGLGKIVNDKIAEIGHQIVHSNSGGSNITVALGSETSTARHVNAAHPQDSAGQRHWMELGWMSYTAPDVRLLPNRTYCTLQLSGNLSLLMESHAHLGLPGLLNLQESHWGSRGPPSRSLAPHVLYEETPQGWVLTKDWQLAAADIVGTLRPLVESDHIIGGLMLGDELVCSGLPLANLSALAADLRAGLPGAFLCELSSHRYIPTTPPC